VQDCSHASYAGASTVGSAWSNNKGRDCAHLVARGGSWLNYRRTLRAAHRHRAPAVYRTFNLGVRLAQDPWTAAVLPFTGVQGPEAAGHPSSQAPQPGRSTVRLRPGNELSDLQRELGDGTYRLRAYRLFQQACDSKFKQIENTWTMLASHCCDTG